MTTSPAPPEPPSAPPPGLPAHAETTTPDDPFTAAASLFRERVLVRGTSLCRAADRLWRDIHIEALLARLQACMHDPAGGGVHDRWDAALRGAPDPLVRLAVEALAVHLLIASDLTETTKRRLIAATAAHAHGGDVPLPRSVDAALCRGRTPTGVAFKRRRLSQIAFLLRAATAWRGQPARARREALGDRWVFRGWLWGLPVDGAQAQREALLHLAHPAAFEAITSRAAKERIVAALCLARERDLDTDLALQHIRARWTPRMGGGFSFSDPPLLDRWRP